MVDLSGDSTDDPVAYTYASDLVARAILDGMSDLGAVERHDGRHHRGDVEEHAHVAYYKVRGAAGRRR